MKKRTIKKWNKVYCHSVVKNTNYASYCYKKLKQYFPFYLIYPRTNEIITIVNWDKVSKYLGINEKEIY